MKKFSSWTLSFLLCVFVLAVAVNGQTTFTNSAPIAIADSDGTTSGIGNPYPSRITVSGMTGTVTDVNVRINGLTHTFPDDVGLMLVGPGATRFMVLQSDVGGGADTTAVVYTFDDQAAAGIPNAGPLVAGTFRPSSVGDDELFPLSGTTPPPQDCQPAGECPQPAPAGTAVMNTVFGGINPNGEWRLYAIDCCALDEGTIVNGWSLIITTNQATPRDAPVDFNGDGRTDFAVIRRVGPISPWTWWIRFNGTNNFLTFDFGFSPRDIPVPADYDGDGKDDVAMWRNSPFVNEVSSFYIIRSSNNTIQITPFGQTNDIPVVEDYDGDNIDDLSVWRAPTTAQGAGQAIWYYRGSLNNPNNNITFVPWGIRYGTQADQVDEPYPGDFDGDNKADFRVQRRLDITQASSNTPAIFISRSATGVISYQYIGWASDRVVPGDYDGDGKTDICVVRDFNIGTNPPTPVKWYIKYTGGAPDETIYFGAGINFNFAQGDYDGDGKTDLGYFVSDSGTFWYRSSANSNQAVVTPWGTSGDITIQYNR